MLMVLVHLYGALSLPGSLRLQIRRSIRLLLSFGLCLLTVSRIPGSTAHDLASGQLSTDGLSVIDAPAPNTDLHAGSNMSIAVDVSAGLGRSLVYDGLDIYLVSAQENVNITVSAGSQLLTQEIGSTVKHFDWPVETCLPSGPYNLTFYETSALNGTEYLAITVVPVQVENSSDSDGDCSSLNAVQMQPQPSNPPPSDLISGYGNNSSSSSSLALDTSTAVPATSTTTSTAATNTSTAAPSLSTTLGSSLSLTSSATSTANSTSTYSDNTTATATPPPNTTVSSTSSQATNNGIITVTVSDGIITIPLSELPGTIVVEPSGGAPYDSTNSLASSGFITITRTVASTTTATSTEIISQSIIVTVQETSVSTLTEQGRTEEFTVTRTLLSTIQLIETQGSSPQQAGLLPVNAAPPVAPLFVTSLLWTLSASALCYVVWLSFAL